MSKGTTKSASASGKSSGNVNRGGRPTREEAERKQAEKEFREGLLEQLRSRNADTPYFRELVDEVIYQRGQLARLKELAARDGVVVVGTDRSGNIRANINLVLREIRETEKAILLILKELKISTDNIIVDDEDDDF